MQFLLILCKKSQKNLQKSIDKQNRVCYTVYNLFLRCGKMAFACANIIAILSAILILDVRVVRENEDSAESCALICKAKEYPAA